MAWPRHLGMLLTTCMAPGLQSTALQSWPRLRSRRFMSGSSIRWGVEAGTVPSQHHHATLMSKRHAVTVQRCDE